MFYLGVSPQRRTILIWIPWRSMHPQSSFHLRLHYRHGHHPTCTTAQYYTSFFIDQPTPLSLYFAKAVHCTTLIASLRPPPWMAITILHRPELLTAAILAVCQSPPSRLSTLIFTTYHCTSTTDPTIHGCHFLFLSSSSVTSQNNSFSPRSHAQTPNNTHSVWRAVEEP